MDVILTMADIQAMAERIAAQYQPKKIILFGSYAYGTPTPDSDVDFLILMPIEGETVWQAVDMQLIAQPPKTLSGKRQLHIPMDIILKTPERAAQACRENDPIVKPALTQGKILYARQHA